MGLPCLRTLSQGRTHLKGAVAKDLHAPCQGHLKVRKYMAPASQELLAFQDPFKHGSIYVHSPDFNSFVLWSWRLSAQPRAC